MVRRDESTSPLMHDVLAKGWWRRADDCRVRVGPHVEVRLSGDVLTVFVGFVPMAHVLRKDRVVLRTLLAALEAEGTVKQAWVGRSGLVSIATFERDCRHFARGGAEEIRRAIGRRGAPPKKVTPAVLKRIKHLHLEGRSSAYIGTQLGLGASTVRKEVARMFPARDGAQMPLAGADASDATSVRDADDADPPNAAAETVATDTEPTPVVDAGKHDDILAPEPECHGGGLLEVVAAPRDASGAPPAPESPVSDAPPSAPAAADTVSADGVLSSAIVIANDAPERDPIAAERALEQVVCRLGWVEEQSALFPEKAVVPHAGALLAVVLEPVSQLVDAARRDVGRLPNGFYGVRSMITGMLLMVLIRCRRPEQLKGFDPVALGAVIGLARMPEMKTVRRKLRLLSAERSHVEKLVHDMATLHAERCHDALGSIYVDGHVRAYFGKVPLPKTHHTTLRTSLRATTDFWVNASDGAPLTVMATEGNAAMTKTMPELLRAVRAIVGPDAEPTIVFDRGGFCAEMFRTTREARFHFLTYRKGKAKPFALEGFTEIEIMRAGKVRKVKVADRIIPMGRFGTIRCIAVLHDDGKQTHILTSRTDIDVKTLLETMFRRWVQENFFRYMSLEYDFNALWTYRTELADPERSVPNPARKDADRVIGALRCELADLTTQIGAAKRADRPFDPEHHARTDATVVELLIKTGALRERIADHVKKRKAIPRRVPVRELAPKGELKLHAASHLLTDSVKVVAYHLESSLADIIAPLLRRTDEARALVAVFMSLSGSFHREGKTLVVTLEPAAAPRYTRALIALCEHVNHLRPVFPGTTTPVLFRVRVTSLQAEKLKVAA